MLYLPVNSVTAPVDIGTQVMGTVWAEYYYTIQSGGIQKQMGPSYVQMATLNLKAS